MRFKVPEGLTELTHNGVKYTAKEGFIEAPDAALPELKAHGCTPDSSVKNFATEKVKNFATDAAAVKQEKRA